MRLTLCRTFNHANRVGWLGYGQKPRADLAVPADNRAFRSIKVGEVPGWLAGRPLDPIYAMFAAKRYTIAWLYKYSRPGMLPLGGHRVGAYGFPGNFALSGSGIAMFVLGFFLTFQLVICKDENNHHAFKKYHSYPLTETLMAWLPFNYKKEDVGGDVALKAFAIDALIAAAIVNMAMAGQNAPSGAMAGRRTQAGFVGLAAVAALVGYNKLTFKSGAIPMMDEDRAQLAALLGCDAADVDELVKKNDEMKNSLRYSMFTNMFMRVYDAVTGIAG